MPSLVPDDNNDEIPYLVHMTNEQQTTELISDDSNYQTYAQPSCHNSDDYIPRYLDVGRGSHYR